MKKLAFQPGLVGMILSGLFIFASASGTAISATSPTQGQADTSYKKDVFPIIKDYCLSCHQPGGKGYEKSGLDMRTYQSLMNGTKFGSVVNPGNSFTSIIIQVVEGRVHKSIKMPFEMNGSLAKDKIETLKKWVNQGAKNN